MGMTGSGVSGELRNGYQVAADLGSWTISDGLVTATARDVNEFWADGKLALWLTVGRKSWVWSEVDVIDINSRPVVIRLIGSPVVR